MVDDDDSARDSLGTLFTLWGYEVETATDGQVALEKAFALSPSLIVTDLVMPHLDGLGLLRGLRKDLPEIPVILLTGAVEALARVPPEGAYGYLTKPVDVARLRMLVTKALTAKPSTQQVRARGALVTNCHAAREWFSALVRGKVGLTERALVEAHVRQCADCLQELERLQQTGLRHRRGRLRGQLLPTPLKWSAGVAALILLTALAIYTFRRSPELQEARRQGSGPASYRAEAPERGPRQSPATARSAIQPETLPPPAPVLAAPRPPAGSAPAESTPPTPPQPAQSTGAREDNSPRAGASRLQQAASAASTPGPERQETTSTKRVAPAPSERQEPVSESPSAPLSPAMDVVVQLSVKDRSVAERDLDRLLARVGGTTLGRQRGFTFMLVVPQSSYGEFTRGLAQIGSWQMEAGRPSLPDPVHVVVRLIR